MYTTCIFCSGSLGTNEAIEGFPVGQRVAFDAWQGRLWSVCSRCGRWNLAPMEERWEAIEAADRLFTDTRSRVQSENIGLARLRDGTRLVRVGKALPGELAAWRYGSQLISRRRQNIAMFGAAAVAGVAIVAGLPLIASAGVPLSVFSAGLNLHNVVHMRRQRMRVVHRLPAAQSPTGSDLAIRRWHLYNAVLAQDESGRFALDLPPVVAQKEERVRGFREPVAEPAAPVRVLGEEARRVVARAMTDYNSRGAGRTDVERALQAIEAAGGADAFAAQAAASGAAIVKNIRGAPPRGPAPSLRSVLGTFRGEVMPITKYRGLFDDGRPQLGKTDALALEMALQEEAERRALEGELAALEAAWREAEEIARIADALPGEPPE